MSLNKKYLAYLVTYPLLTKSVTAGVLGALNESLASAFSGDYKTLSFVVLGRKFHINHVISPKILSMVVYGALISTPISHTLYGVLNRIFNGKMTPVKKLLQLLTSLLTITPTLTAVFVAWLSFINGYSLPAGPFLLSTEVSKIAHVVKTGLKNNFFALLRTSVSTSLVSLVIAQNFLKPELWVVFFNLVYFVLGTIQNTKVKNAQRKLLQQKRDHDEQQEIDQLEEKLDQLEEEVADATERATDAISTDKNKQE